MTHMLKRGVLPLTLLATVLLAGCGVSQSQYDALQAQNQQLQQQVAADQQHISRLQSAIKYTVNSDLLFPSGSWQISADGKSIMTKMASQLAAYQQDKLVVNGYTDNAPIGPALAREGVTSNEILSQKRADSVMQFLISQGVKSNLISAKGWGEANPIASNSTPKGRAQNRRVEITLAGSAS
jgi:chemotaxis protein MotB